MINFIPLFLLNPPSRLRSLGQTLAWLSSTWVVIGLYFRIGPLVMNALPRMKGADVAPVTLAAMYPSFPTWLVPESSFAFIVLMCMWAFAIAMVISAKKFERIFRSV
jgi:predicted transporter